MMPLPKRLEDLLTEPAYADWEIYNWRHRRFFLVGASYMLSKLRIPHTNLGRYMEAATVKILAETDWASKAGGDYKASKIQLYPSKINDPKTLDKAAAIVVAFAEMAKETGAGDDVFKTVRITPAFHFVDNLTPDRLRALTSGYEALPKDHRASVAERNGLAPTADLQEVLTRRIEQPAPLALLREMSVGHSVTPFVATGIVQFVEEVWPGELRVGGVRTCGDPEALTPELGRKDAAPSLRVPRVLRA